ncbi:hypothetical protein ACFOPX_07730 [Helicobacter baculiformis]|uniref:Beta-1,4-N-acetylgalactosaminyltransferase n=1 Tax=Helicobacter baculiformis TaxID=427351 RepID=A0ABV7ZII6_9HELI
MIPKDEWVIKIDVDHIYDAKKFYKSFYDILHSYEALSCPRINFRVQGRQIYIQQSANLQMVFSGDQLCFCNTDVRFVPLPRGERLIEKLHFDRPVTLVRDLELAQWHFPYVRTSRHAVADHLKWITLEEFKEHYANHIGIKIDPDMLDAERILAHYAKFNLD